MACRVLSDTACLDFWIKTCLLHSVLWHNGLVCGTAPTRSLGTALGEIIDWGLAAVCLRHFRPQEVDLLVQIGNRFGAVVDTYRPAELRTPEQRRRGEDSYT